MAAPTPTTGTSISGIASKGPLKRALVTAYPVGADGVVGTQELAHSTTDDSASGSGTYTLFLGNYAGAVQLVLTAPAGTATADEASGSDIALPAAFVLHANTVVIGSAVNVTQLAAITPFTELAHQIARAAGGITASNIANANNVVFTLVGVDPVTTQPVASNVSPATDATDAQKRYGLFNAAVSKLASSTASTTDATTVACLTAAAGDLGKKIDCVVQQIATSVTVSGTDAQATTSVNNRMVGLADALVAASADPTINKTGVVLASTNSAVKTLTALETAAAAGTPSAVSGGTTAQGRSDVAIAKAFFSGLRSNAAALHSDAISTGIVDGVKAFGDSLRAETGMVTDNTVKVVELARMAANLWQHYKDGQTTSPNSPAPIGTAPGAFYDSGCTVYQGSFPSTMGTPGTPFVSNYVVATSPSNASWVGCSVTSGPLLANGTKQYRQSVLINMGSDPNLAVIPYLASTRARYSQNGTVRVDPLTPTYSGTLDLTIVGDDVTAFALVGDLPPATAADGSLLAQRYAVNFAGTWAPYSTGIEKISFGRGSFGVVPVGAASPGLVVDLSVSGESFALIPATARGTTAERAPVSARVINLSTSISDTHGRLNGTVVVDQFTVDSNGDTTPGHVKFAGDLGVAPVINGTASPIVSFLSGTIEATNGAVPVVSFSGSLYLPNRPATTLAGSVTETASGTYALEARYVQSGITVNIEGTKAPGTLDATFADSTGVSTSVGKASTKSNVTVGGRQTAVIDRDAKTITYADGTFESLI